MESASHQSLCCWDTLYSWHATSLLVPKQLTGFPAAKAAPAGTAIISALHHHLPHPCDAAVLYPPGGGRRRFFGWLVWFSLGRHKFLSWSCSHTFPMIFCPWTLPTSHSYCPHTLSVPEGGQFPKVIGLVLLLIFIMTYKINAFLSPGGLASHFHISASLPLQVQQIWKSLFLILTEIIS